MEDINEIVIVGGGCVGSFISVLCALLQKKVTVYEKRDTYTREINVKIEPDFFSQVLATCQALKLDDGDFFSNLQNRLEQNKQKILIKDFETLFKQKALELNVTYIHKEVNTFDEVYASHKSNKPLILDCTGRKSPLRINKFGEDSENMEIIPLESAMYINFRAVFDKLKLDILYPSMKNDDNIKLSQIVASKKSDSENDLFKNVTIPIFISENLAQVFDKNCPDINREPLMPFKYQKTYQVIPAEIFQTLTSVLTPLLMEDWLIDFESISIKKIEITCGYAMKRSSNRFICLGDSAVHLAYFKSLNFGLKHALDFFVHLTQKWGILKNLNFSQEEVLRQFKKENFNLNPIHARELGYNTFMITTKVIWNGVYTFCLTNKHIEHLTDIMGVNDQEVEMIYRDLRWKYNDWEYLLSKFEQKRDRDIEEVIKSNQKKNKMFDYVSDIVWLNAKSPIKISELLSEISNGYSLFSSDLKYFNGYFLVLREYFISNRELNIIEQKLRELVDLYKEKNQDLMESLRDLFDRNDSTSFREKIKIASQELNDSRHLIKKRNKKFFILVKLIDTIIQDVLKRSRNLENCF